MACAVGLEHANHLVGLNDIADAYDLAAQPRRIGQRTEHVEHGRNADLGAHRRGKPHRGVERASERETHACFAHTASHAFGRNVVGDADRCEEVERTRSARCFAVAVLAHHGARAGGDEARHGRDIERSLLTRRGTTRADDVDRTVDQRPDVERRGRVVHGPHHARHLLDRLAFHAQRDDEGRDLRRGRLPLEDLRHGDAGHLDRQRAALREGSQDTGPPTDRVDAHVSILPKIS
ncbi:unannotated protein [freshwater metagenome]|uniref:Unannotated protein n=1 Tax=freshwater metagenome TaxID=449393 RepID=A0A6J7JD19_9ZZZZ